MANIRPNVMPLKGSILRKIFCYKIMDYTTYCCRENTAVLELWTEGCDFLMLFNSNLFGIFPIISVLINKGALDQGVKALG